jgi:hypothetical protein
MARKKPDPRKKAAPAPRAKAVTKAVTKAAASSARDRAVAKASKTPSAAAAPAASPDLRPGPIPVLGNIPWSYGQTRITAIARDPHCVFAYWEYPDQALEEARKKLNAPSAGPVLRVYDTTYRIFDGTNAHGFFDVPVDRTASRYYFHMNRPATTFVIDIGAKEQDRFATIARSGPAETPRDSYSGDGRVDWMTVPPSDRFRPYQHRFVPRPGGPQPPGPPAGPATAVPGAPDVTPEQVRELLGREGWVEEQWQETAPDGNRIRCIRWSGPIRIETSVAFPGKSFEKFEIEFSSDPWTVKIEKGERRVFGPWNVSVHGWETRSGRRVLQRWTMHSSWITEEKSVRIELPVVVYRILAGMRTRFIPGGSEARLQRESWSSELLLGGASELRWLGGSELRMAGASETMFLAASEWLAQGASEWLAELSSYSLALGGSERWKEYQGGSEKIGGASERWSDYPSGSPLFPPGGEKP